MRRYLPGLVAVAVCLAVAVATLGAVSQQGVPLPLIYGGNVFIQGTEAPEGLSLFACVQGCPSYRSDSVTTGPGGEYSILVVGPPNESFLNKEITFWIENEFGGIKASQTVIYTLPSDPRGLTPTLNLEFADPLPTPPPPTPTPTPTITPTPSPTPLLPIPGDASVPRLSTVALIAGIAAVVVGGGILLLLRRRNRRAL